MALERAPRGVLAKSQFLRPITKGLMERSARLLSNSRRPSERKVVNLGQEKGRQLGPRVAAVAQRSPQDGLGQHLCALLVEPHAQILPQRLAASVPLGEALLGGCLAQIALDGEELVAQVQPVVGERAAFLAGGFGQDLQRLHELTAGVRPAATEGDAGQPFVADIASTCRKPQKPVRNWRGCSPSRVCW